MKITIEFEQDVNNKEAFIGFLNTLVDSQSEAKIATDKVESKVTPITKAKQEKVKKAEDEIVETTEEMVEEKTYTIEDAKSIASSLVNTHREEILKIIHSFGVKKLTQLTDPDDINSAVKQLKALQD